MHTELVQQSPTIPPPYPAAEEYLASLHSLAHELDRAMEAIVARALPAFEDSISRQVATCARLVELSGRSSSRRIQEFALATPCDGELAARIAAATATLVTLNKRYAALLQHSGDTVRLFAGIFRGYKGTQQQATGMSTNLHTWSCEL